MRIFDYIIVGQGISGTVLGYELRKSGFKVLQFDTLDPSSPSRVAAGIWHPMVFKRLTATWMASQFIPAAEEVYKEMEECTKGSFFNSMNYARLLSGVEERNNWDLKSGEPRLTEFMGDSESLEAIDHVRADSLGPVKHAGFLDTRAFLDQFRLYFGDSLLRERFDSSRAVPDENGVSYELEDGSAVRTAKLVFADGPNALTNTFFNWVPFQPVKGEVITIYSASLKSDRIYSKGVFICPIGENLYNVGATYNWRELNQSPTNVGLAELKEKLNKVITVPYEVVEHRAGIRPAVRGRRPLLGSHPKHKTIWLFNGMGSKAVLMAPYWARHMVSHWHRDMSIKEEVLLARFYSFYNHE